MKKSNGRYTDEIKIKALELIEQGIEKRKIISMLKITSVSTIRNWERKYKAGGIKEVLKDERGLKAIGRPKKEDKWK